jgi:hypothetical protein
LGKAGVMLETPSTAIKVIPKMMYRLVLIGLFLFNTNFPSMKWLLSDQ